MTFRGWTDEALTFYEGLEADNSKAYWTANKEVYDRAVRGPMEALLAELAPDWGDGKLFRPYRDVRFSADKTPYKTHIGAMVGGVCYVQLSADGLAGGCGSYDMASDQLERFREAIDDEQTGSALAAMIDRLARSGIEVMAHGSLKSAPRGYPKDHPRIELLRLKGLVTWQSWRPAAWLGTAKAKGRIVGFFEASRPVAEWLAEHVGSSTLPPR